jgi:phosphoribosylglycinamide formyltransferase-1
MSSDRSEWDRELLAAIESTDPDWIVSAGFMRILGPAVLSRFQGRIVNTHPAWLPAFPGAHAVRDALAAGATSTGCTVHFVDGGVDTGPVIAQRAVEIFPTDNEASLHERIKVVERDLIIEVVQDLVRGSITYPQDA